MVKSLLTHWICERLIERLFDGFASNFRLGDKLDIREGIVYRRIVIHLAGKHPLCAQRIFALAYLNLVNDILRVYLVDGHGNYWRFPLSEITKIEYCIEYGTEKTKKNIGLYD